MARKPAKKLPPDVSQYPMINAAIAIDHHGKSSSNAKARISMAIV
jgi:hypothetical protein